jgi:hypothetical protein
VVPATGQRIRQAGTDIWKLEVFQSTPKSPESKIDDT